MTTKDLITIAKDNGLCSGFITGVSDEAMIYPIYNLTLKNYPCIPPEVHSDQLVSVVKKYLEDNPAKLHLPAGMLTIHALIEAFPCR